MKPSHFLIAAVVLALGARAAGADSGDAVAGEKLFATCAACHAPGPGRTGPDLHGVVGRPAGTLAGFRFSRAMKNARRVWSEATLDAYLAEPQAVLPGNAMPFPGLPDHTQRRDLIAYLKTLK